MSGCRAESSKRKYGILRTVTDVPREPKCLSFASYWPWAHHFRSSSLSRHIKRWSLRPVTSEKCQQRIWYSSLTDLTPRIDPYAVVIGSAGRSEFQSKLACSLESLRRITRRERHGSGYVRKASASRGGKHR